jgi:hypothetical protein
MQGPAPSPSLSTLEASRPNKPFFLSKKDHKSPRIEPRHEPGIARDWLFRAQRWIPPPKSGRVNNRSVGGVDLRRVSLALRVLIWTGSNEAATLRPIWVVYSVSGDRIWVSLFDEALRRGPPCPSLACEDSRNANIQQTSRPADSHTFNGLVLSPRSNVVYP